MASYWFDLGARAKCQQYGTCSTTLDELLDYEFDSNSTTPVPSPSPAPGGGDDMYIGFICCAVAVVMFGLNWIPAKKYDSGDGVFFQFILCNAAFVVGIIVHAFRSFPPLYPLAMLSGALWCTGNMLCVTIIKFIGMGLGLLLWSSTNLMLGWASGKWGWFGITPQTPTNIPMNYGGVALALISALLFVAIKPNVAHDVLVEVGEDVNIVTMPPRTRSDADQSNDPNGLESLDCNVHTNGADFVTHVNRSTSQKPRNQDENLSAIFDRGVSRTTKKSKKMLPLVSQSITSYQPINNDGETSTILVLTPAKKRVLGVCFALFSGCLFGLTFTPIIYIQDHPEIYPGASKNVLDHIFAMSLGIYCATLTYFLLYCVWKKNHPWISAEVVLPSFICGLMWAVGQSAFLMAIQYLSEPVSFPIIASGPGIIAAVVGVVFFKEIQGTRNYLILLLAFLCVVSGAILSGLSKS